MTSEPGRDTPTGIDPEAKYIEPGYKDKSFGQATVEDAQLAEDLMVDAETIHEAEQRYEHDAIGGPVIDRQHSQSEGGLAEAMRYLRVYLADHRAGAALAIGVAQRSGARNADNDFAVYLAEFRRELISDRDSLDRITRRFGLRPLRLKAVLGMAAAAAGTFKLSGRWIRYSPLSRVLEFETLMAGVEAKRRLWHSLQFVDSAMVEQDELERLISRADQQLADLGIQHRAAVAIALGAVGEYT
jgi:hypothetical protein